MRKMSVVLLALLLALALTACGGEAQPSGDGGESQPVAQPAEAEAGGGDQAVLVNDSPESHRKVLSGYSITFIDQLITIVSATTIIAYSLYTFSAPNLSENHSMMLTIPFVLYGIFRYLYLINKHNAGGEPEEILLTDRPIQLTVLLWGVAVIAILYLF